MPRLKMVKLATDGGDDEALEIEGGDLRRAFWGSGPHGGDFVVCSEDVAALIVRVEANVRREIEAKVERDGWRALRAWVKGGGYRSRLC